MTSETYSPFCLNWIFFSPLAIWYKGSFICNTNLPRNGLNSICLWSHSSFSIHISLPPNLPYPSSREDRSALAWKMGSIVPIHSGHEQRRELYISVALPNFHPKTGISTEVAVFFQQYRNEYHEYSIQICISMSVEL